MKNGDMPAAPIVDSDGCPTFASAPMNDYYFIGLTKREAFAMAAMQVNITAYEGGLVSREELALEAVWVADAMLAALEKIT